MSGGHWSPAKTALATEECGLSKEPASPARVSLPEAARELLQTVAKLPHPTVTFISQAFTNSENRGATGGHGLGVFE